MLTASVIILVMVFGAACYVVGDYFGFRRGKEDSYQIWCSRLMREQGFDAVLKNPIPPRAHGQST